MTLFMKGTFSMIWTFMGAKQTDTECRNTEKFDHKVSQFYVGAI